MSWKLATFNVNGVRARLPIVTDWLRQNSPDVLLLQETKVQDKDFPAAAFEELGYHAAWHGQKSYNGVAIISRSEPGEVRRGFGEPDEEARLMAALLDGVWVVNTYVPQGRDPEDPAFQAKLAFLGRMADWCGRLFGPGDRAVWAGDINVAPTPLDVFDPERLDGQVGFHPDERAALTEALTWGWQDLFRLHHPEDKQFSFWDYRLPNGFKRNLGWRIDHVLATAPMAQACTGCWVDAAPRGLPKPSDHTPVAAEFAL